MSRRRVEIARDQVEKMIGASVTRAVSELIWNGFDAGGNSVEVTLRRNGLDSVHTVEVVDRGRGIPHSELDDSFLKIGGSKKASEHANAEGRKYHGREGKGRFRALALSPVVRWETAYRDQGGSIQTYTITLGRDEPDYFDPTDPMPSDSGVTGTRVVLEGIDKGGNKLGLDSWPLRLAQEFAAYLQGYPDVSLSWDGKRVQVAALIDRSRTLFVSTSDESPDVPLDLIEWNVKLEGKRLHICDEDGFSFHDIPAGVHAPGIEYTAYLRTPHAREWSEHNRFALGNGDTEIGSLLGAVKAELKHYFRQRLAEQAQSVVQEWKDQNIYPYQEVEAPDPVLVAEREVFDIVSTQVNEAHPTFSRSDVAHKKLTLALIRQALEANPSALTKILRDVAALPKKEQEELADLLDRTSLSNIVRAGRIIGDRLDKILAFEHLMFDVDWKKRLLERTQLHRLLVHELWILGEEYSLGSDDDGLRDLLAAHLSILGRDALAPDVEVKLVDGKNGIPDLMLHRRRKIDRDRFEHLVIELKRPSIVLGQEETSQIKKYAFKVAKDGRFDTSKCSWEFVLLGNSFDEFVELELSSDALPEFCLHDGNGVRIWVRKWADVINDARARYEFFREQLGIEASHSKGLEALRERYPHLMEGRGASKKADLAAMATPDPD